MASKNNLRFSSSFYALTIGDGCEAHQGAVYPPNIHYGPYFRAKWDPYRNIETSIFRRCMHAFLRVFVALRVDDRSYDGSGSS